MQTKARSSFAFLVVAFNHQDYILEHLESIKYLVQSYGADIDVDVIINDDCSKDNTRALIDMWLQLNEGLFRNVKTIYNHINLGTCASVNNMLKHLVAERCKLTAGDDVYSFENIFELTLCESDISIVSGRVLYLRGDELGIDRLSNVLEVASQVIYQHDSLLHRLKHFSYINAPNTLYATDCLLNPDVCTYLTQFDVTEDWPLQIAIAREYPERRFHLIDHVLVYYRRTLGSTYITANQRFNKDKNRIYSDLITRETSWIEKLRLRSRQFCFQTNHRFLNKILNLDLYFFLASCLLRIKKIYSLNKNLSIDLSRHERHFNHIKLSAEQAHHKQ